MHKGIDPQRPLGTPRARRVSAAILVSGVLVAGCGSATRTTTMVVLGGASAPASTTAAGSPSRAASPAPSRGGQGTLLEFAKCMRAHGVSNFPDPIPSGDGFQLGSGLDRSAPAFKAAQAKCHTLLPVPGGPGGPKFSEQSLIKVRQAAVCMRAHGISQFPDPTTTPPPAPIPPPANVGVITDFDGAFLVFPATLNMDSPAYLRAADACGTLARKLGKVHH